MMAFFVVLLYSILASTIMSSEACSVNVSYTKDGRMELEFDGQMQQLCIPPEIVPTVEIVTLSQMAVERHQLIYLLQNCKNLTELNLKSIYYSHKSETFEPAYLPNLKQFYVETTIKDGDLQSIATYVKSLIWFRLSKNATTVTLLEDIRFSINVLVSTTNASIVKKIEISNDRLIMDHIKDDGVFEWLGNMDLCLFAIRIEDSIFRGEHLNCPCASYLELRRNILTSGTYGGILATASNLRHLTLWVSKFESMDAQLLPAKSLSYAILIGISIRWSSISSQIQMEELRVFFASDGDLDLNLFNFPNLKTLLLYSVFFWNSSFTRIATAAPKLEELVYLFTGKCEHNLIINTALLPPSLRLLKIRAVDIIISSGSEFKNLQELSLIYSNIQNNSVQSLNTAFPNMETFSLYIGPQLNAELLFSNLFKIQTLRKLEIMLFSHNDYFHYQKLTQRYMNLTFNYSDVKSCLYFTKLQSWTIEFSECIYKDRWFSKLELLENSLGISWYHSDTFFKLLFTTLYIICIVGVIGNILTILVLMRRAMRNSTGHILTCLAISDSLLLISTAFFLNDEFHHLLHMTQSNSKLVRFFVQPLMKTSYTCTVYFTILINIERLIAVSVPMKAKFIFSLKRTQVMTGIVIAFSILLNLVRFIESMQLGYTAQAHDWNCYHSNKLVNYPLYIQLYHKVIWYTLMYLIPFVVIVALNVAIWIQLHRSQTRRRNLTVSGSEEKSLTKVLLTIVLVFVICNATSAVIYWWLLAANSPSVSEIISCGPLLINSSVNFIIYCLMGQKFRNEFKKMLGIPWRNPVSNMFPMRTLGRPRT